jgi:hypothetical protein
MKKLILASILCLACAADLRAQEKPQPQMNPFEKRPLLPPQPVNPNQWSLAQPREFELKGIFPGQNRVCSVPLLEARGNAIDPGMAFTPQDKAAPMPKPHVPAPACEKK